jgi:hypothetical protein
MKNNVIMAVQNVEWISSERERSKLVVDSYLYQMNGKGKLAQAPNVRYWVCASSGCSVRAKTDGNIVVQVTGTVNPADHGHVNDRQEIADIKLKVRQTL